MEYCTTSYATRCPSNRCSTPKWDRSWSGYKGPRRVRGINVCRKENYSHSHSHALLPIDHSLASEHLPLSATRIQKRLLAYLNFFLLPSYFTLFMRVCGRKKDRKSNLKFNNSEHKVTVQKKVFQRDRSAHVCEKKQTALV